MFYGSKPIRRVLSQEQYRLQPFHSYNLNLTNEQYCSVNNDYKKK